MIILATKNIVPRAAGEGSIGIPEKPWGHIYANNIPLTDSKIAAHNALATAHPNGIAGNAATASKLSTPVKINGVDFDGTQDINISLRVVDVMSANTAKSIFLNA